MTGIAAGSALNISLPLMFELIMEAVYGWGDESAGAMLTVLANTIFQIGFLVVFSVSDPNASTLWTSWTTAGSMGVCAVALLFLKVEYRRLAVDRQSALSRTGCAFDRSVGCY